MPNYALRKSVGPFSAGTRVIIRGENRHDKTYTVEMQVPDPKKGYTYDEENMVFDIDKNDVVKLRDQTANVTAVNRKRRRSMLRELFGLDKRVTNLEKGERTNG